MVKHTQTIRRPLPTNCLNVFDHFVGLALKSLSSSQFYNTEACLERCQTYMMEMFWENNQQPLAISCFCKKINLIYLTGF